MRYWWVNQNQTFDQEFKGGYLWSPKRKSDGRHNPFYEFMREVAPGDLIFSFHKTWICAIGVAQSVAYSAAKPAEFGAAGPNWSDIGWQVDVSYQMLDNPIRPADLMDQILPILPERYGPLQATGRGNQGVYLTFLSNHLADFLIAQIGVQAENLRNLLQNTADMDTGLEKQDASIGLVQWEEHLIQEVQKDRSLQETQRETLILARRGQGQFKENVSRIESHCRVTKVDRIEHLRASHIKPWRDCQVYEERLAGGNGLLLTPTVDHLFDRGYISFEDSGRLICSPVAHEKSLNRMGIQTDSPVQVGTFNEDQRRFMDYHREYVFLEARIQK